MDCIKKKPLSLWFARLRAQEEVDHFPNYLKNGNSVAWNMDTDGYYNADPSTDDLLRAKNIPWEVYMTARLITETELKLLQKFDRKDVQTQARLLEEDDGASYFAALLSVLKNVTKDETVQYVLALFDTLLTEAISHAVLLHSAAQQGRLDVYSILLRLLSRKDWYTQEKASQLLALAIASRPMQDNPLEIENVIVSYVDWICGQLRRPVHSSKSIPAVVHAASIILKDRAIRSTFVRAGGVRLVSPLVSMPKDGAQLHIQLLYDATLCAWLLSFDETIADSLATPAVIGGLVDMVRLAKKEKLVRIALLAMKNLLEAGGTTLEYAAVEKGLAKAIELRVLQTWDDEDVPPLLEWMADHLEEGIFSLSSFERYKGELQTGKLHWGPIHESEAFWLENAEKLSENNCALLKVLLKMLEQSQEAITLAVACRDLANYVKFAPHGRGIASELKGKELAMRLMMHPDSQVQREALMTVQVILLSKDKLGFLSLQ